MFKKVLIASTAIIACSGVVFAGGSYNGEKDYKGEMTPCPVYAYAAGPYLGLSAGIGDNYSGSPTFYKGLEGTLSAGYASMLTQSFYLAGEIFGGDSWEIKNLKNNGTAPPNSSRTTWSYGASLIPGYMITDYVLFYARGGAVRSRFSNQSANATGWQVGLGGQTNIAQNLDIRGEYVYTGYGSVTRLGNPASDVFNLGIVYKFV